MAVVACLAHDRHGSILALASTTRSDRHVDRSRSPAPGAPEVRAPRRVPRRRVAVDPDLYARAAADPEGYWAEQAATLEWIAPWEQGARLEAAAREVVRRRQAQRVGQLPRPAHPHAAPQQGRAHLGGRAGRPPHADVLGPLRRGQSVRATCSSRSACRRATASAIYLPLIPEAAIAMLACARIGAIHSVVFGGFSPESLRDRINDAQCKVLDHRRRRLSPRPGRSAQAQRRQGARGDAVDRARRRRAAPPGRRRATRRSPR